MMNASIQIRLFVFVTFFNPVYKVTFSERDFDWECFGHPILTFEVSHF